METSETAALFPPDWMHNARDGTRLFIRALNTGSSPKGVVLLVHGFGEHSGRYLHVMRHLAGAGLPVVAADLRGHGRSQGARGDIASYEVLLEDLLGVWNELSEKVAAKDLPIFLYGHSLGGQIILNFAAAHRPAAAGLVVTSPWLKLAFAPARGKMILAWIAGRLWPSFRQGTAVRPERLSRDMDFLKGMADLHLVHHRMSARMYRALSAGAARAEAEAPSLTFPILLLRGSDDPVTSVEATARLFQESRSHDKSLALIPEALHETHNDLCREQVAGQITAWLLRHCGDPGAH